MELRTITAQELVSILEKHRLWLSEGDGGERADLSNANLRNADLRNANLRYADLSNADLSNADLRYADLRNANLRYADLSNANLRNADLRNADLRYADLSNADLSNADLRNANLRNADLSNANLRYADLILAGQDIRGYLFWAFVGDSGAVEIQAGCRHFVGVNAARLHWTGRHGDDEILRADCLSFVDRIERMAQARGWKLEVSA